MTMKKLFIPLIYILLSGFINACNMPLFQNEHNEAIKTDAPDDVASTVVPTETATLTLAPTLTFTPTLTPEPTLTEYVAPSVTPGFAPFCKDLTTSNSSSQCQLPIAEQSSAFCTKKTPYNLLLINQGASYEVLSEYFSCADAGTKNDKKMVTCTGPMALNFEVQVCDPACSNLSLQTGTAQCPVDYAYNNIQGCCTKEQQIIEANCTVLKLKTTSCTTDCGQYTKKNKCDNNSYACIWDNANAVCIQRQ